MEKQKGKREKAENKSQTPSLTPQGRGKVKNLNNKLSQIALATDWQFYYYQLLGPT
jgi:hypothetical protein